MKDAICNNSKFPEKAFTEPTIPPFQFGSLPG